MCVSDKFMCDQLSLCVSLFYVQKVQFLNKNTKMKLVQLVNRIQSTIRLVGIIFSLILFFGGEMDGLWECSLNNN